MNPLIKLDMFGKEVKLNHDGKQTFKTLVGSAFSLIIYFGTIILLWYFGKDMYLRENPKLISNRNELHNTPYAFVDRSNFSFGIKVTDKNGKSINDPKAYTYRFGINQHKSLNQTNVLEIRKLEQCTIDSIPEPFFTEERFSKYLCPDFNNSYGGSNDQDKFSQPKLEIFRCNSLVEKHYNITCYTDEELINKYGYYIGLNIKLQIQQLNPTNFTYSTSKNYYKKFWFLQAVNTGYTSNIIYTTARIVSDSGLIFEDEYTKHFFQFDSIDFYNVGAINKKDLNDTVAEFIFQVSSTENYYHREYIKLPDAIANVGGFIGIIVEIFKFVLSFYVDNEFAISFYQKLFKLEIDNEDEKSVYSPTKLNYEKKIELSKLEQDSTDNMLKVKQPEHEQINLSNVNPEMHKDLNNNNDGYPKNNSKKLKNFCPIDHKINKDVTKLVVYKAKKRENVTIKPNERFCYLNCVPCYYKARKKNPIDYNLRYELINRVEIEIKKKLDFIYLLKSIDQLRLVEKTLFNENQCFMIENRESHSIVNDKKSPSAEVEDLHKTRITEKTNNLFKYLSVKKNENSLTMTDKLLFKYLNSELLEKLNIEIEDIN